MEADNGREVASILGGAKLNIYCNFESMSPIEHLKSIPAEKSDVNIASDNKQFSAWFERVDDVASERTEKGQRRQKNIPQWINGTWDKREESDFTFQHYRESKKYIQQYRYYHTVGDVCKDIMDPESLGIELPCRSPPPKNTFSNILQESRGDVRSIFNGTRRSVSDLVCSKLNSSTSSTNFRKPSRRVYLTWGQYVDFFMSESPVLSTLQNKTGDKIGSAPTHISRARSCMQQTVSSASTWRPLCMHPPLMAREVYSETPYEGHRQDACSSVSSMSEELSDKCLGLGADGSRGNEAPAVGHLGRGCGESANFKEEEDDTKYEMSSEKKENTCTQVGKLIQSNECSNSLAGHQKQLNRNSNCHGNASVQKEPVLRLDSQKSNIISKDTEKNSIRTGGKNSHITVIYKFAKEKRKQVIKV